MKCVYCGSEHIEDLSHGSYITLGQDELPHRQVKIIAYTCEDCGYIMYFEKEKECE